MRKLFGKNYSDSPKYIYEYLQKNYPGKYRFIWVMDKKGTVIPYKHTEVKRFSIRYLLPCPLQILRFQQQAAGVDQEEKRKCVSADMAWNPA